MIYPKYKLFTFFLICAFFIFTNAALFAQGNAIIPNQISVFLDVRMKAEADNSTYNTILAKNTGIALQSKGYATVPGGELARILAGGLPPALEAPNAKLVENLRALAREQRSRYLCLVRYIEQEELGILNVYFWNIDGASIISYATQDMVGLAVYNRMDVAVTMFVNREGEGKKNVVSGTGDTSGPKTYVKEIILISKDEGCEIFIKDKDKMGIIKEGKLVLPYMPLTVGSKIIIEKKKEGFYPASEELTLTQEKNEFSLAPLEKIYGSGLVFVWTTGQFIGLGVGYIGNINERFVYWGVENYLFLQVNDTENMNPVVHDDIRGYILYKIRFSDRSPLTVSFSSGLGIIFSLLPVQDSPLYVDFYLNPANLHLEYAFKDYVLFLRAEYKIALGFGRNLLESGLIDLAEGVPLFSLGVITRW